MTAPAIFGAGSIRLDVYDPVTQSFTGYGNELGADKFEITGDIEEKQKTSKKRDNYGAAIASVIIPKPSKIAITISELDNDALALQFQGIRSAWTQGAASVADEAITAKLDKWISLSKRNLADAGFLVKDSAGTTTYAIGTDYLVNYATGEVKLLSTGTIAADAALKVSFDALALSGQQIRGGTRPQARMRAKFEGVNKVDDQYIECEVWEAVVSSSNGFDFLADDFNGVELTGTLVVPSGKTEPYMVRLMDTA